MIVITDSKSVLGIELVSWDGDAYLGVTLESHGFSGRNDLHVEGKDFRNFCRGLVKLQSTLSGKAVLRSVDPRELEITFESYGSLGHISVKGRLGYYVDTGRALNWHAVEFGFEVDPQNIDEAVRTAVSYTHLTLPTMLPV